VKQQASLTGPNGSRRQQYRAPKYRLAKAFRKPAQADTPNGTPYWRLTSNAPSRRGPPVEITGVIEIELSSDERDVLCWRSAALRPSAGPAERSILEDARLFSAESKPSSSTCLAHRQDGGALTKSRAARAPMAPTTVFGMRWCWSSDRWPVEKTVLTNQARRFL